MHRVSIVAATAVSIPLIIAAGYGYVRNVKATVSPLRAEPLPLKFGEIGEGKIVSGNVRLTNTSDKTLTISAIAPSCGCTSAGEIKKIAAHSSALLPVTFNSSGRPGSIRSNVVIATAEYPQKPLTITLDGSVKMVIQLSSPSIALGVLHSGSKTPFAISITSVDGNSLITTDLRLPKYLTAKVETVDNKTVRIRGTLTAPPIAGQKNETIVLRIKHPLLPEIKVPVEYTVASEFVVAPEVLNFGEVNATTTTQKSIHISGQFPGGLRVKEAPESLTVSLHRNAEGVYTLNATVPAQGKQGILSERVVLATGNVKQPEIVVPVFAAR